MSVSRASAIELDVVDPAPLPVLARRHERRQMTHRIAAARILDLDDLGAELGKQHRRKSAGKQAGQVQDAKTLKWKMRAKVGDRVQWYQLPEEVGH